MSGILSGLKIVGSPGSGGGGGNATVPEDAFILPPQAYVDNVALVSSQFNNWDYNTANILNLSNKGITLFRLFYPTEIAATLAYVTDGATLLLNDNNMSVNAVIDIYSDFRQSIESNTSPGAVINTFGPNMGCPLNVPGTVGGWTLTLDGDYVLGTPFAGFLHSSYYPTTSTSFVFSDTVDFLDSSVIVSPIPGFSHELTIGVQDSPTKTDMLEKMLEYMELIMPGGDFSVASDTLTFVDTVERAWFVDPGAMLGAVGVNSTNTGANPSNADIDYLITQSCTGSFTGPDGITQINF